MRIDVDESGTNSEAVAQGDVAYAGAPTA